MEMRGGEKLVVHLVRVWQASKKEDDYILEAHAAVFIGPIPNIEKEKLLTRTTKTLLRQKPIQVF